MSKGWRDAPKGDTVTETATRTDAKAGYCSNCRRGDHALCASAKCECSGRGLRHTNRPKPYDPFASSSPRSAPVQTPPRTRKWAKGTRGPVVELVWGDPPELIRTTSSLFTRVASLLDELKTKPGSSARILLYEAPNSATGAAKTLRKQGLAESEWELTARRMGDQSGLWARYIGGQ